MPTEAFYKLEPAKKEQLIVSAINEFSELPYEKVSIFKIAQNADVSRSGFYYYFKDKRDIYGYLISEIKDEFVTTYDISSSGFDIFHLGECIFNFITDIKGTDREKLFRRIVSNTTADDMKLIFSFMHNEDESHKSACCIGDIQVESKDKLNGLIIFIVTGIMYSLGGYLDDNYDLETAKFKMNQMFELIRYGLTRGV